MFKIDWDSYMWDLDSWTQSIYVQHTVTHHRSYPLLAYLSTSRLSSSCSSLPRLQQYPWCHPRRSNRERLQLGRHEAWEQAMTAGCSRDQRGLRHHGSPAGMGSMWLRTPPGQMTGRWQPAHWLFWLSASHTRLCVLSWTCQHTSGFHQNFGPEWK